MPDEITVVVDGAQVSVPAGATAAVAIVVAGRSCRRSMGGEARGPLCAMGICFECRATVNGRRHSRTCQMVCETGMDIRTNG